MNIDWSGLKLNSEFIGIAKAFMVHMLEKYSPSTAYRAARQPMKLLAHSTIKIKDFKTERSAPTLEFFSLSPAWNSMRKFACSSV